MSMHARQEFAIEAIGAQLRRIGEDRYSVEFLEPNGTVRAVRPASPLEVRMWQLLCSSDGDWSSATA
jgi:hypothetical protein